MVNACICIYCMDYACICIYCMVNACDGVALELINMIIK